MSNILELSDEKVMEIARQLRVGYEFKRVLRYDTKRDQSMHNESDAEHVFGLEFLADYFLAVEKLDPCFEMWDPVNGQTPRRLGQSYESHITKKLRATEMFPVMRRFVEVISADMLAQGMFAHDTATAAE